MQTSAPPVPAVEFQQVVKRFGPVVALHPLNLAISKGELVTLLGPSGCGKTTLLRLIAGLELPSEGVIRIDGREVTGLAANQRDVSLVFQSYALFPHMNALDNVCYGLLASGIAKPQAIEMARTKMELLGIADLGSRLSSQLSGGQQQRVAVARSLVLEPAVLMFDEPLSNLDAKLRRKVRQDIRDLQQSLKLTVVYVTHDQEEALAVSDRIVVMEKGRIGAMGTPHTLYESPATRFIADFIGDANLIEGTLDTQSGIPVFRAGAGRDVEFALDSASGQPDGPVALAVRPHRIRLGAAEGAVMTGTLQRMAYLGSRIECIVQTPVAELLVFTDPALRCHPQVPAWAFILTAPTRASRRAAERHISSSNGRHWPGLPASRHQSVRLKPSRTESTSLSQVTRPNFSAHSRE